MGAGKNAIFSVLDKEAGAPLTADPTARIAQMAARYEAAFEAPTGKRLLGFLLQMGYDEMSLVTCDAWKKNCGGVPRNSFVIVKLNEKAAGVTVPAARRAIILARISATTTTPVANDIQSTIFQIHKVQATVDPLTSAELQWGALSATILGTYYDNADGSIGFGNDVDNFMSPHFYEVYAPLEDDLDILVNAFVHSPDPLTIGHLRFTETQTLTTTKSVDVRIAPEDFIANRTALFGKTRMGKSNTIKVSLDTMLRMPSPPGQIVFDLSGEYTYPDPQTGSSIYLTHQARCSRYSLRPRITKKDADAGAGPPDMLRSNFFTQIALGHSIIVGLFGSVHSTRPDYMAAFLAWAPVDSGQIASVFTDVSSQQRYKRALAMYKVVLHEAGFADQPSGSTAKTWVDLVFNDSIREYLASQPNVAKYAALETKGNKSLVKNMQELRVAARLYELVWDAFDGLDQSNPTMKTLFDQLFPVGSTGKPYFEAIHRALLRMLGDKGISGPKKLTPFLPYHDPAGSDVVARITADVESAKTVIIDLANADPVVASYYSEMITRAILSAQMKKFSEQEADEFVQHSVLFYFEEAHNLFRSDDKDLNSVYNKLAKEGAKFRVGMVYATQSMTTLSPDLLKNTENFFIAHLNDDREVREIERRYEFNGIGLDVQRARSKGYVRMITLSHRYALPVQIRLFDGSVPAGSR